MSLHTVHLEGCGEQIILPSLEMLRFLKRLKLRNMQRVREVLVPSLEELVLDGMTDLQRCSCTSMGDMKANLSGLEIQRCPALEVFDLFQKGNNYKIDDKPWLPSLRKLIMLDCPHLQVQIPLPPSAIFSELSICRVSTIQSMEGSSMGKFEITGGILPPTLDDEFLAFHNIKDTKYLVISSCRSLTSISFKGLSQLISLKNLRIVYCIKIFSSDDVAEQTHEDMITANDAALPAFESLDIIGCGITWKWLSLMLRHSPTLKELQLCDCRQLKQLNIEDEGNTQSNLLSAFEASSSGYLSNASSGYTDDTRPTSVVDGVMHIPLNLRKITIRLCPHLIFDRSKEGFAVFTSLGEEVEEGGQLVWKNGRCLLPQSLEQLVWCDYSRKTLWPGFVGNITCLKKLEVKSKSLEYLQMDSCTSLEDLDIRCECLVTLEGMQSLGTLRSLKLIANSRLKSLNLDSCTSLERLKICSCNSLVALKGLRSLLNLKHLRILGSPALDYSLTTLENYEPTERISCHSYELLPALESLKTDDLSHLRAPFCKGLTCLRSLTLGWLDATGLTDEQESALLLLGSLQELCFDFCEVLVDLPAGLHGLPSLKSLEIRYCESISGLPKKGLPPSLEKLDIFCCSDKLSEGCRLLATSKLAVKIHGCYID